MKQYQRQTIKMSLEEERKVLNSLKKEYAEAKKQVKKKIDDLMSRGDANLPNVIHQVKYQKAIEMQIDDALSKLNSGEYQTISDYLEESYGTGFTSSLYRLQKQGIPLIFPMNRNEIIKAVQLNSKISGGLYKRLGINTKAMKNAIRQEVTRGISSSMSSADIARNIDNRMNSGLYNSYRIARTEGHRINQEASFDAMTKAKEAGADVVKQWDSTLDGRTRPHHRMLDGQVRELEDPFEVDGLQAQYPSGFGKASEDINCRCVMLEIGRWELDEEDTFTKFDGDEGVIVSDLSNVKNYEEFRKKYNIEVSDIRPTIEGLELPTRPKRMDFRNEEEYFVAKEKYKNDKQQYNEKLDKVIDYELNKPKKYDSVDSMRKWAESRNVKLSDEFLKNVDVRAFDDIIDVQNEMFEKFPQVKETMVYELSYFNHDYSFAFMRANGGLGVSEDFKDYRNAIKEALKNMTSNYTVKGDLTIKTSIRHEFGHNVDDYIRLKRFYRPDASYEVQHELYLEELKYEKEIKEFVVKYSPSEYSKVKVTEGFAELFAEALSNPTTELSEEFFEFLEKWL